MGDTFTTRCRFVVLISGRGSNMQAIVNAIEQQGLPADVVAVIANKPDATGLQWAQDRGLTIHGLDHRNYASRQDFDNMLAELIDSYHPDYILLAGYMRVLTPEFVSHFPNSIVNIHPSLLPAFPGLKTHQQALNAGVQWHGCTVHFVTPVLDHGPIIAQGVVAVQADDNPDTLAARVLRVEHRMYADVTAWLAHGRVSLDTDQRVHVSGAANRSFLLTPQGVETTESIL
ncbi:phosphoribosylglycinamide formyltransferase [Alcaligenaceae bacterium]|nr:phosphoribosylglycinamide formyltransferase [Alcaligenaceae bacterium]